MRDKGKWPILNSRQGLEPMKTLSAQTSSQGLRRLGTDRISVANKQGAGRTSLKYRNVSYRCTNEHTQINTAIAENMASALLCSDLLCSPLLSFPIPPPPRLLVPLLLCGHPTRERLQCIYCCSLPQYLSKSWLFSILFSSAAAKCALFCDRGPAPTDVLGYRLERL